VGRIERNGSSCQIGSNDLSTIALALAQLRPTLYAPSTVNVHPFLDLIRDVRYAVRGLRRHPFFSAVAVLTLALGMGATTAIFSVVHAVIVRPLPYSTADRLVSVGTRWLDSGRETARLTGGDLVDLRSNRSFDAMSAYWGGEIGAVIGGAGDFVGTFWVEPAFFEVFGVRAVAGRAFGADDGEQLCVVSQGFAERRFGSSTGALGQSVSVEGQGYRIGGVMPAGFDAPHRADLWLPSPAHVARTASDRTAFKYRAVARLAAGVSAEQAQRMVDALGMRLAGAFPGSNRNRGFSVMPLQDRSTAQVRATLFALSGAVSIVLIVACVNVASLLLARSTARADEIALRAALGASRWRVLRQLLAESLVLAVLGAGGGVALAVVVTPALLRLAPASLPRIGDIGVNWPVLAFTGGCAALASLVFGLAPAWRAIGRDRARGAAGSPWGSAPRHQRSGGLGAQPSRLRALLVVVEVALAFALAVGAGLLVRSYNALSRADLGYRSDSVVVMYAHRPASTRAEYVAVARSFASIGERFAGLPGVEQVAAAMGLPAGRYGSSGSYFIEGRPAGPSAAETEAGFRLASPRYFATLGVPLKRGRDFDVSDAIDAPFVAIVSESLARQQFRDEDPIGRRLRCGLDAPNTWMTIVGVVGDVRQESPGSTPQPELYMPLSQHPYFANEVEVIAKTSLPPASVVPAMRARMRAASPETAVEFTTLDDLVLASVGTARFRTWRFSAFAGLALLLAMAGIFGVTSYITARRTPEFGLRMALGASRGSLFAGVVGSTLVLGCAGIASGTVLALSLQRLIDATPGVVSTYAATAALMLVVVGAAAAIPAWRAAHVDPVVALRRE
jgi:putative ABC transport system permease protein